MLKLGKLPDRTPVRIVITVSPDLARDLARDLAAYAEAYRQAYGQAEVVVDLIPPMLAAFLASDRGFARARGRMGRSRLMPSNQPGCGGEGKNHRGTYGWRRERRRRGWARRGGAGHAVAWTGSPFT
ncbi:DUF2274 domain-containing protein [Magnetospirillum molischianum]|uniref:DUF2274 domain-containing protein n=1 Tax=Magnetospirillum molischianum DSM 120 TaxID=1150626 RepID=H8FWI7_MAGML|nr:DUF2274 domain-containing protein [Magnetospirillum molischianum]CCG42725.1 conserved hypothetical protein [Magnetospirillum molischianum DSM 120]